MLHYESRKAAEYFLSAADGLGAEFVLRFSTVTRKWATPSKCEAAYIEERYPGHLLRPENVETTPIIDLDDDPEPHRFAAAGFRLPARVRRIDAQVAGVKIEQVPPEVIVEHPHQGIELYRRSVVLRRPDGTVETVSYKPVKPGSALLIVENK